jgi:hypothetical protein
MRMCVSNILGAQSSAANSLIFGPMGQKVTWDGVSALLGTIIRQFSWWLRCSWNWDVGQVCQWYYPERRGFNVVTAWWMENGNGPR